MTSDTLASSVTETDIRINVVVITVNEKTVKVNGPRISGLAIKQAAIDQGIPIELDFILSEELPGNRTRIVGDDDIVTVNKNSRFLAIPNDDNS